MLRGPQARLRLVGALLVIVVLLVIGRLVLLQIVERGPWEEEVTALVDRTYSLPEPPTGVITDRNGDLLVGNLPIYDVGAEYGLITDTVTAAQTLAPLLGTDVGELQKILDGDLPEMQDYAWWPLANGIGGEAAKKLEELKADKWYWLTLQPQWRRYYPEGDLASHTLGFVNAGEDRFGYGVEAMQQRFLRPQPVVREGPVDAGSAPFADELARDDLRSYPGTDLRLTIDRTIQAFVEDELDRAIAEYGAFGGTILVIDPRTGGILAVASSPRYDPSRYADYSSAGEGSIFVDPAISIPYEPGSVFKVITIAAALDSGSVSRDWSYYDSGRIEYGGAVIQNWDRAAYGQQNLQGVLNKSLNVGVATLTTQFMGGDTFYHYVREFGFGQKTGIGLADEVAGFVHLPTDWDWTDSTLATNAFGQGIAVTPLQMATAVSALANHGTMMAPHVVAERRYPDGRMIPINNRVLGQPISKATADYVAHMMENYVADELANARVPGYRVAGKTGTAQIPVSGGYDAANVITSFIGFGPMPDPQVLILVKLDRPQNDPNLRWGTQTAAPVFSRVASRLFVLLGIPPSEVIGDQVADGQ